jgi:hypothetical protein
MGSFRKLARPTHHQQNFLCGKNGGGEAKNRRENITIRSFPYCNATPQLAAPQAQP